RGRAPERGLFLCDWGLRSAGRRGERASVARSTVRTRPTLLSVDQGRGWSLSASWPSFWVRGGSGQVIPTASRNTQLSTRQVSRYPRPVSKENLERPVMSPPERSESEDESPGAKRERGGKVPPADGRG